LISLAKGLQDGRRVVQLSVLSPSPNSFIRVISCTQQ